MPRKSVIVSLAAALAFATSTAPAFAIGHTRSFQSLPSAQAHAALSFGQSSSSLAAAHVGIQVPSHSAAPVFNSQSRFGGGRLGNGLATLFGFLPPRLQQVIANVLGNAGPGGTQLCRLLGIPQCQIGDSTG